MLLIIHGLRCLIPQAGMRSLRVIEAEKTVNPDPGITWSFVFIRVYILVLNGPPKSLDKDVVICPSPVVHADPGSGIEENLSVFRAGEVTALIGIHDLRSSRL